MSTIVIFWLTMKCPHCNEGIHESFAQHQPVSVIGWNWVVRYMTCPECKDAIIRVRKFPPTGTVGVADYAAYPSHASARPVPSDVEDPYKQDFIESCAVLPISPKASAALSRRNLQAIIRDKAGVKGKDLNAEIQALIDSKTVPSYICDGLHAVRQIGNFAAHPIKSTATGEIVDVEEGEAEWNLDVLESLFDFYFVQPALTAKRKSQLNIKLAAAGKPLIP